MDLIIYLDGVGLGLVWTGLYFCLDLCNRVETIIVFETLPVQTDLSISVVLLCLLHLTQDLFALIQDRTLELFSWTWGYLFALI